MEEDGIEDPAAKRARVSRPTSRAKSGSRARTTILSERKRGRTPSSDDGMHSSFLLLQPHTSTSADYAVFRATSDFDPSAYANDPDPDLTPETQPVQTIQEPAKEEISVVISKLDVGIDDGVSGQIKTLVCRPHFVLFVRVDLRWVLLLGHYTPRRSVVERANFWVCYPPSNDVESSVNE